MGRLITFIARSLHKGWGVSNPGESPKYIHGIGVSQKTGVLLESNGIASIVGKY
jgi:hypothetical protein